MEGALLMLTKKWGVDYKQVCRYVAAAGVV
jgi:hypothetical protein